MIENDKLADSVRQIIPAKKKLAAQLIMSLGSLGCACLSYFVLKTPIFTGLFVATGIFEFAQFMERLTWRWRLLAIL